jgi:hypothetical protein
LHAAGFLCDAGQQNQFDALVRPLKQLLPCRYCRDSFVGFYDGLGPAKKGQCSMWAYEVHKLVNKKLAAQRLDKLFEALGAAGQAFITAWHTGLRERASLRTPSTWSLELQGRHGH